MASPNKQYDQGLTDDKSPVSTTDHADVVNLKYEVFDSSSIDPILAKKMHLINNAIDEIGMTPWQWRLFFLNGFGYAVDSVTSCIFPR